MIDNIVKGRKSVTISRKLYMKLSRLAECDRLLLLDRFLSGLFDPSSPADPLPYEQSILYDLIFREEEIKHNNNYKNSVSKNVDNSSHSPPASKTSQKNSINGAYESCKNLSNGACESYKNLSNKVTKNQQNHSLFEATCERLDSDLIANCERLDSDPSRVSEIYNNLYNILFNYISLTHSSGGLLRRERNLSESELRTEGVKNNNNSSMPLNYLNALNAEYFGSELYETWKPVYDNLEKVRTANQNVFDKFAKIIEFIEDECFVNIRGVSLHKNQIFEKFMTILRLPNLCEVLESLFNYLGKLSGIHSPKRYLVSVLYDLATKTYSNSPPPEKTPYTLASSSGQKSYYPAYLKEDKPYGSFENERHYTPEELNSLFDNLDDIEI